LGLITSGPIWYFTTQLEPNDPPGKPSVDGSSTGKPGVSYDYVFSAVDPDGDDVRFIIDWGDTGSDTTGYVNSGVDVTVPHTWSDEGTFVIVVYAEDEKGLTGPDESLSVTIKKSKSMYIAFHWLYDFLESHPNLFPMLRYLVGF
jgi:hypothetical protein